MRFEVLNRYTRDVQFTAEIDCDEAAPESTKRGLAVKWAVEHGANLAYAYLARANLAGADLSRANLSRADLARADLHGANLAGGGTDSRLSHPDHRVAQEPDTAAPVISASAFHDQIRTTLADPADSLAAHDLDTALAPDFLAALSAGLSSARIMGLCATVVLILWCLAILLFEVLP